VLSHRPCPPPQAHRVQLLCCDDPSDLHHELSNIPILGPGQPSADELAQQAAALYRIVPPVSLRYARGAELAHSVAAAAYKVQGRWVVPEEPPPGTGELGWTPHASGRACHAASDALGHLASAASICCTSLSCLLRRQVLSCATVHRWLAKCASLHPEQHVMWRPGSILAKCPEHLLRFYVHGPLCFPCGPCRLPQASMRRAPYLVLQRAATRHWLP
jgi:hypothetical protein